MFAFLHLYLLFAKYMFIKVVLGLFFLIKNVVIVIDITIKFLLINIGWLVFFFILFFF